MTVSELRTLYRQAMTEMAPIVGQVDSSDLARLTPCAGWDLGQLLAHMLGQNRGFAAAVTDGTAPKSAYAPTPFDPQSWAESVDGLLSAFAGAEDDAAVVLIELLPNQPLPLEFVLGGQLLDTVVHTWDVASSLELTFIPSPQLVAPILAMAKGIPDDDNRREPDAAFAPALSAPEGDWGRVLAMLGRRLLT